MKIVNLLLVLMAFFLMHSEVSRAGDNSKIGVVDFQQILQNSKSGHEVQSKIKQKGEALKFELQNKQDEIKGMQEKYKRESVILSDEQKVRKEREIRAELNEYRVLQNQNTQKFNKIRSELIFAISLEDKQLYAQLTGQPKLELFPYEEDRFFYKTASAQIGFNFEKGKVTSLTLYQKHREIEAKKIE